jgi:hypothetical protein
MAVPKSIQLAKGLWRGKSRLNLPWLPPEQRITESNSDLRIDTDSQDKIAWITYDWHHEGKREEGTIILCENPKSNAIQLGWVDSWHQNKTVLHLLGDDSGTASVKAKGEYNLEGWGWTIELLPTADTLSLKMENVTPAGEPTWAVEGAYLRNPPETY